MGQGIAEGREPTPEELEEGERRAPEIMPMGWRDDPRRKPPIGLGGGKVRIVPEFRLDEEREEWEATFTCHFPANLNHTGEGFALAAMCQEALRSVLTGEGDFRVDDLVAPPLGDAPPEEEETTRDEDE